MGTKTITMHVLTWMNGEIAAGQVFQLTIGHPDGSTQQLDILAHLVELFGRDAEIPMGLVQLLARVLKRPPATAQSHGVA